MSLRGSADRKDSGVEYLVSVKNLRQSRMTISAREFSGLTSGLYLSLS